MVWPVTFNVPANAVLPEINNELAVVELSVVVANVEMPDTTNVLLKVAAPLWTEVPPTYKTVVVELVLEALVNHEVVPEAVPLIVRPANIGELEVARL